MNLLVAMCPDDDVTGRTYSECNACISGTVITRLGPGAAKGFRLVGERGL